MLIIFRRHLKNCSSKAKGRDYRRCQCPMWVEGSVEGQKVPRRSLDTKSWERATEIVRKWEEAGRICDVEPIKIEEAQRHFREDAAGRNLKPSTLKKYRVLFDQMNDFAKRKGLRYVTELDITALRDFRNSWQDGPVAATKKLERLRAFLNFCVVSQWIQRNPARDMKPPKATQQPTMPLEQSQVGAIIRSCKTDKELALVMLLRFSGMRIEDVTTLACDRLRGNKLFLYTHKTGVPVYVPLPNVAVDALESMPKKTPQYFFWTGQGKPETMAGNARRTLRRLFRRAGIPDAHPHRFRDTFAVELLLAGVPIERVSVLLGHSSVKITEKHYAPWVRSRQEQLEADVAKSWAMDPSAHSQTNSTQEVHEKKETVN